MFATEAAALSNLVRFPKIVARVRLDRDRGFMIARTYADIDQHYTVWGDPRDLLERVDGVSRIDPPE